MKNRIHGYKKIFALLCILSCFFGAMAQDAAASDGEVAASVSEETISTAQTQDVAPQQSQAAATAQVQTVPQDTDGRGAVFDENAPFASGAAVETGRGRAGSVLSTVGIFVRMILVLAFVIACIYGFVYFMRKSVARANNSDQFLRVVSSVTLAPGKSVQIVSLLDEKAYMLGVSDNSVNVIAEVENKETISAMNLYADKMAGANKPKSFEDILNIFMPGGTKGKPLKGKGAVFDDTATDMLRRTREEFSNQRNEDKTDMEAEE